MEGDIGPQISGQLLLIFILLLINAFFIASEMAIISVDKKKLVTLKEEGNIRAGLLLDILEEPSKLLSTMQVGITLTGFFASALASIRISGDFGLRLAGLGIPFPGKVSFILTTILLSYIFLVLGNLVPKRMALNHSEKFSMFSIRIINLFAKIMGPFISLLSISTNFILRLFGISTDGVEEKITLEEIRSIVEVGQEQGVINPVEREMIDSIIGFDDKLAEEVMTARTEVFMIDIDDPIDEYLPEMLELKYSRIPVYEDDLDNILGVLYLKDFLKEAYKVGFKNIHIKKIIRPAYFIPERKNINALFKELQANRKHMAVLIDEYGGFSGIVTMEDLIEEIMGDIDDEYDYDEPDLKKIDDYNYIVKGAISIKELNSNLGSSLDVDSEDYDTLGGFLIDLMGYIPEDGDKHRVEYENIQFNIEEISEKRIQIIHIVIKKDDDFIMEDE